jgi:hypothetical protein
MKTRLKQTAAYHGDDWWKWSVWVESDEETLDRIEYVEYTLHPSFPEPVIRIKERSSKFRLDAEGWGEFTIRAQVVNKDGSKKNLKRWLELKPSAEGEEQDQESATAGGGEGGGGGTAGDESSRIIFLSCNIADAPFAAALSRALSTHGARVLMTGAELSTLPWEVAINQMLEQADVAVFIISDPLSSLMRREIGATIEHEIPIIPLLLSSKVNLSEFSGKMEKAIQIKPVEPERYDDEAGELAKRILKTIEKLMSKAAKKEAAKS